MRDLRINRTDGLGFGRNAQHHPYSPGDIAFQRNFFLSKPSKRHGRLIASIRSQLQGFIERDEVLPPFHGS
jgi:hypothetical protein